MEIEPNQTDEGRGQRAFRQVVSALLVAEAASLTAVTIWIVAWVPMMMFAAVEPIAASLLLTIASVHLFRRRRRILVAILCGSTILLGIGPVFVKPQSDYVFFLLLAILIPLAGVMAALRMKPRNTTTTNLSTPDTFSAEESKLQKVVRMIVGILLAVEALLLLNFALFVTVIVPFIGGLAFIAGAGDASDSKIAQAWWIILAMVLVPWAVTASQAVASIQLLMRKRPKLVAVLCAVTIMLKILALMALFSERPETFPGLALLIFAVPVAALLVATLQLIRQTT